jgi:Mce-associated membrane protein
MTETTKTATGSEATEASEASEGEAAEARSEGGRPPGAVGASLACRALAVAAAVFLTWACWSYWDMRQGDVQDMARDRDRAVMAARQQIAALNTMDARHVDRGLQNWLDASTGPLHDELKRTRVQSRQKIQSSGTSATGTVSDAALTALDRRAGTARVIATVRIEISGRGAAPTVQRKRYDAALTRTAAGWKLKSLTALPVNTR